MTVQIKPIGYECRFVFHVPSCIDADDAHFIKEIQHFEDGTTKPFLRKIENFKRDIYVTNIGARNHKSKKEFEKIENLTRIQTTERHKVRSCAHALKMPWYKGSLRDLAVSPYLYGADIDSTGIIKQRYIDKYKEFNTRYSVAIFDVETDVIDDPKIKEIIMATVSFKDRAITAIQKKFVQKYKGAVELIQQIAQTEIGETLKNRNITWDVVLVDSEIDVVKTTINKAHEWKPDFLACWNMLFDIERVLDACDRAGVRPEDILNDPSIPEKYRYFYLKVGPAKRITASGVLKPFKPSERWHTVYSPASFYWIDAMGSFRQIRTGQKEEPSYALDAILKKYTNISKLKFDVCAQYSGLQWHEKMQSMFPLHYAVYNLFDCIGVEILDEKTYDLCLTIGLYSGCSEFSRFNSQPKRKIDELYFFLINERKCIIGTVGSEMDDGFDKLVVPLKGWITMLYPHLTVNNGLKCIEENPHQITNIHPGTSDLDVSAAYPTNQIAANISKKTTVFELVSIDGVPREVIKMNTINYSSGHVNALEFCTDILDMPTLTDMGDAFEAYIENKQYNYQPKIKVRHFFKEEEVEIEIPEEMAL